MVDFVPRQGELAMSITRLTRSTTLAFLLALVLTLCGASAAFASDGTFLTEWGTGAGSRPVAIDVDPAGNAYVTQIGAGFNRVEKFDSSGSSILTWGGGVLVSPRGIAVDPSGTIVYVADYGTNATNGQYVRKYDASGNLLDTWSGFGRPDGVAVDSAGNVYVAERGTGSIKKLDSDGTLLATWSGPAVDLNNPIDVAVDSAGYVYVTDRGNNRVRKLDSAGNVVDTWTGFAAPDGIGVDAANNVYVAEYQQNRARKFDSAGGLVLSLTPPTAYDGPRGIAVDSADNVYVTDMEAHRIVVFGTTPPPPPVSVPASSTWSMLALALGALGVLYLSRGRLAIQRA